MHLIRFPLVSARYPSKGAYSAPQTLAGFKSLPLKGEGKRKRKRWEMEGMTGEGRGKGREVVLRLKTTGD